MRLDVRKALTAGGQPLVVQSGVAFSEQRLTKSENRDRYTYLGPDGVANNADNTAARFVNPAYLGEPIPWANQPAIQWIDNQAVKEYLISNPNQFVYDQAQAITAFANTAEYFKETLSAAYVQGEIKLLQSRLNIVGGVRFERTENYGEGLLNRDGTLVVRGTKASRSYDNWFPSVNATYSIRPSLQLRAAYSKTIGRPQQQYLIPNLSIQDLTDTITLRNKDLKAWTSDNLDLALAWYFGRAGTMSVGVFKKTIANGFQVSRLIVNDALRQQHGLETQHLGWTLTTTTNSATKLDLTGVELDVQTELENLVSWAKGFSVFANGTQLSGTATNGSTEQFPAKRMANWGVSYSRGRLGASLNWTYSGKAISSTGAFAPDGQIIIAPMTSLDFNTQFRFTKRFRVFANVRNLNREPAVRYYEGTGLADYAGRIVARKDLASIRWTVGVAGEF
jgi:TonB-dependent receptor